MVAGERSGNPVKPGFVSVAVGHRLQTSSLIQLAAFGTKAYHFCRPIVWEFVGELCEYAARGAKVRFDT